MIDDKGPDPERRTVKRRAIDKKADAKNPKPQAATVRARQSPPPRVKKKALLARNPTGARVGYDPYESGLLVKQKNPGVRRDLRSLGTWLRSGKKPTP